MEEKSSGMSLMHHQDFSLSVLRLDTCSQHSDTGPLWPSASLSTVGCAVLVSGFLPLSLQLDYTIHFQESLCNSSQ